MPTDPDLVDRIYDAFVEDWHGYIDISVRPRNGYDEHSPTSWEQDDIDELRQIIKTILEARHRITIRQQAANMESMLDFLESVDPSPAPRRAREEEDCIQQQANPHARRVLGINNKHREETKDEKWWRRFRWT